MIELPKKCLVNKFISKKTFYEKISISNAVKDEFVNEIEKIFWLYKLSEDTIGISKTEKIEEIEIFQLNLKNKTIPKNVIKTITKGIPYKILFILKYNEEFCYSIKVDDIFATEWNKEIEVDFNTINLDILFEFIVKQVIDTKDDNRNIKVIIDEKNTINDLEKKINHLKTKIKKEKQFNKKVELNNELNKVINELEEITNE